MKKTNKKGFTLAELLVVVAIIAVLVAIAIPIFTSQLEKAREATDLANLRAAYAECTTAVLTGNSETTDVKPGTTDNKPDGSYEKVVKLTQKTDGFADKSDSVKIGSVTLTKDKFTTGTATVKVTSTGTATITIVK